MRTPIRALIAASSLFVGACVTDGGYNSYGGGYPASYPGPGYGGGGYASNDSDTVRCESSDMRQRYCRVRNDGVRLLDRHSDAPCREGRDWGADRGGVWVTNGCRATFRIYRGGGGGYYGGGGGDDGRSVRTVRCESTDMRRRYCSVRNDGVRLDDRLSDAPCRQGTDWGSDRGGIWVANGCRADFRAVVRSY